MRYSAIKYIFIPVLFVLFLISFHGRAGKNYSPPLEIPLKLSATLGEIRGHSLHQGIDIKTNGRIGYPVYAVSPGKLTRLISKEYGYGNAIFFDHDDGRSSVYGHLDRFEGEQHGLDTLCRTLKVLYNSDDIDINLSNSGLFYRSNLKIGYSGESGSGVPHLHFEIRDGDTYLNPLEFIKMPDGEPPVIEDLYLCIERDNATVYERKIAVKGSAGQYHTIEQPVVAPSSERMFFKLSCYDNLNARNRVAVYGFRVYENGRIIFNRALDYFKEGDIDMGRHVYDISKSKIREGVSFAYFLCDRENYRLHGEREKNNGYINLSSGRKEYKIQVLDFHGNVSEMSFIMEGKESHEVLKEFQSVKKGRRYSLSAGGDEFIVDLYSKSLYSDTMLMVGAPVSPEVFNIIHKSAGVRKKDVLKIFSVRPSDCVYENYVKITIKSPARLSAKDISRVLIYRFFEEGRLKPLSTKYYPERRTFEAYTKTNGYYVLIRDRVPPGIYLPPTHEFCEDEDFYRKLRFYAVDNVSKIDSSSVMCIIDGESFPCKYDGYRKWIEVSLLREAIDRGFHHVFVSANDRAGNRSVFRDILIFNE